MARDHMQNLWGTILKLIVMKQGVDVEWIDLAQDRDRRRTVVKIVIKLRG
jgi:hypothetical protein